MGHNLYITRIKAPKTPVYNIVKLCFWQCFCRAAVCSTRVLVVVLGARLASLFVALWAYRAVVMSLVWAAAVRSG